MNGVIKTIQTSYYVGADWLNAGSFAVYVQPKLRTESRQTDYYKMLLEGLSTPGIDHFFEDIFEIKPDLPSINLPYHQDILTPLLITRFLHVLKSLVRRGLKRSYYPVTENLAAKVKGKIVVSQHIKQNVLRLKPVNTVCTYNEFGFDGLENRLLKKALNVATRFIGRLNSRQYRSAFETLLSSIRPAFEAVADNVDPRVIKSVRVNAFYRDYKEALYFANLIFKRFGFNLSKLDTHENVIPVPPFWIDMSKLFELYVLAQLRKEPYGHCIRFQPKGRYGAPDFVLTSSPEAIMDAKYKPSYDEKYLIDDIRQLSGYARDEKILRHFRLSEPPDAGVVNCVIIYPTLAHVGNSGLAEGSLMSDPINQFTKFYKTSVQLPLTSFNDRQS